MICCNEIPSVVDYGSSASYCCLPTPEQVANGVVPLDSLPAAWWNAMWAETNRAVNCARGAVGSLITELNTVLTQAGVCACATCTDQLYQSINIIRQRIGDASVAGAVKSSSTCGQVSISNTGIMTANGLGNTACLNTTSKEATGAINELKSTYDTCWTNNTTALSGKAPTSHASSATTYGVGTSANYGHLKISDTYTSVLAACSGVAASQKALACVYSTVTGAGYTTLGDTAGCALGTAAAGTATTAARSDHVHPKPTQIDCSCKSYLTSFTASADRPIMVTCPSCCNYQIVGYSTAYAFTFNPATGEVKAKTFTGAFSGTATNATCFGGCTYACAKANILSGNAASATNSTCFSGCTYAQAKADILSGNAATATNATCFGGCTYACAKADIRNYTPATATNATCFGGCTYACAKADILTGCAADSNKFGGCTYAQAKANILTGCAADSAKLGGTAAACYLLKTGCAADSAKLGGTAAACYALKTDCAPDSAKLGGTAAACYALKAGCVARAGANGSGTAFGTAAVCAADCFAPKAHASTATTYGAGNASNYGHVKLSDTYTSSSNGTAACSVGASQCAVYAAYTAARCLGNATNYSAFAYAAAAEAAAASCTLTLGLARSFRWCACTTNVCSYDRRTYTKIGTYQCQNACAGYSYLDTCVWQCCYSGTEGVTTCTNRRWYFHSNGYFQSAAGFTGSALNAFAPGANASKVCNVVINAYCTNADKTLSTRTFTFCGCNGYMYGNVSGTLSGTATRANCLCITQATTNANYYLTMTNSSTRGCVSIYNANGFYMAFTRGTAGTEGVTELTLGNTSASSVADNQTGRLTLYNKCGKKATLCYKTDATTDVTITLPTASFGTSATVNTGTAANCIPTIGTALAASKIVVTDADKKLTTSSYAIGSAASCTAGAAVGNVPIVGTALGTTDNSIVVTDTAGKLKASGCVVGSAATKTAGAAVGNVPLIGTALGTTADKIVLTTAEGKLKPSSNTVGTAAYCTVGSAINNVPKIGTALTATNGYLVATDASGNLKNFAGINVYCGTTCKCTLSGATTSLCLCANAFNANAAISTTTYPGACCTGTVTVADVAYDNNTYIPLALCTGAKTVGKTVNVLSENTLSWNSCKCTLHVMGCVCVDNEICARQYVTGGVFQDNYHSYDPVDHPNDYPIYTGIPVVDPYDTSSILYTMHRPVCASSLIGTFYGVENKKNCSWDCACVCYCSSCCNGTVYICNKSDGILWYNVRQRYCSSNQGCNYGFCIGCIYPHYCACVSCCWACCSCKYTNPYNIQIWVMPTVRA